MNSVDHKGFLMFLSHWDIIGELPAESFKRVLQAVFSTVGAPCSMPEDMSLLERVAFAAVEGDVRRSLDLYDERRRRRVEAGRKGGRKKAENASKMAATSGHACEEDGMANDAALDEAYFSTASLAANAGREVDSDGSAPGIAINASEESDAYSSKPSIATNASEESDAYSSKASIATNASYENNAYSSKPSNAKNARNASLANLANLHKDKEKDKATDKDKVTDKAKARAMDKENKKPLSVVDAAAPDETAACAAGAAPHTEAPPLSAAHTGPSHAQPSPKAVNAHFEALWALYPIKRGKNQVSKRAKCQLMDVDTAAMQTAIARYVAEVEASAFDRQWLNGSTWFNGRYLDYLGEGYVPPPASGAPASARSRETSYRSAEEASACAARYAALEE